MALSLRPPREAFPRASGPLLQLIEQGHAVLSEAVTTHQPVTVFCMFSGGRDSLATTLLTTALLEGPEVRVAHINTGIGIPQTRAFVRQTAAEYGWRFTERHPPEKSYGDMVREHGLPGPGAHRFTYIWLKERAIHALVRGAKWNRRDRVLLVTGVRREESRRRMGNVNVIQRQGTTVWAAPLHGWTGLDVRSFLEHVDAKVNPISDILGYSGECLCGAFAKPGERDILRTFYPDVEAHLSRLEAEAAARGLPCKWGPGGERKEKNGERWMPLCAGCESVDETIVQPSSDS